MLKLRYQTDMQCQWVRCSCEKYYRCQVKMLKRPSSDNLGQFPSVNGEHKMMARIITLLKIESPPRRYYPFAVSSICNSASPVFGDISMSLASVFDSYPFQKIHFWFSPIGDSSPSVVSYGCALQTPVFLPGASFPSYDTHKLVIKIFEHS